MSAFCFCVCVKEGEISGTSSSSSSSSSSNCRSMEYWLNKVRRVCVAVFSRIKHPKSLSPGGSGGTSDDFGSVGLMKLQDVVETCGYHDVHVMWNLMINKTDADADGHDHDQRSCSILGLEKPI
ncbi:hypothetical protein FNV43_RR03124 [Rhamnella rubrinervis]|uniref:Uncharacterized protein n=1 Tax=Rhamnella rubrinervis TaxID=2594499 RepID=A0A8K0MNE5_9ROSA|nr:hypothetical protein FNV43_RR03124 [Rhamnella rubrinervis]